jgi:hypothetical protein
MGLSKIATVLKYKKAIEHLGFEWFLSSIEAQRAAIPNEIVATEAGNDPALRLGSALAKNQA